MKRRFSHVNPTADVVTTIRQYKAYLAEHAYSSAPGMFWGVPKPGDTFDILFPEPLRVTRIVVLTGATINKKVRLNCTVDLCYLHLHIPHLLVHIFIDIIWDVICGQFHIHGFRGKVLYLHETIITALCIRVPAGDMIQKVSYILTACHRQALTQCFRW